MATKKKSSSTAGKMTSRKKDPNKSSTVGKKGSVKANLRSTAKEAAKTKTKGRSLTSTKDASHAIRRASADARYNLKQFGKAENDMTRGADIGRMDRAYLNAETNKSRELLKNDSRRPYTERRRKARNDSEYKSISKKASAIRNEYKSIPKGEPLSTSDERAAYDRAAEEYRRSKAGVNDYRKVSKRSEG